MSVNHGKLHHKTPGWVDPGARFHVRISADDSRALTEVNIGRRLIESAEFYHERGRWYSWLFLLMPDHIHAVLAFPKSLSMSRVIGDWKKYHEREMKIAWQEGYFDHRLRNDDEFVEKCHYMRKNPVRAGICASSEEWQWVVEPWKQR